MKIKKIESTPKRYEEVEVREALSGDLAAAERISGKTEGIEFTIAVISQCCVFDGEKLPPEALTSLTVDDLTALGNAVAPTKALVGAKS
jgi:hypothetical protein